MNTVNVAGALIAMSLQGNIETAMKLHEELKAPVAEVLSAVAKAKKLFEPNQVVVLHGDMPAIITGFNQSSYGFYDGARFPVLAQHAKGTFEYPIDVLQPMPKAAAVLVLTADGEVLEGQLVNQAAHNGKVLVQLTGGKVIPVGLDELELA